MVCDREGATHCLVSYSGFGGSCPDCTLHTAINNVITVLVMQRLRKFQ